MSCNVIKNDYKTVSPLRKDKAVHISFECSVLALSVCSLLHVKLKGIFTLLRSASHQAHVYFYSFAKSNKTDRSGWDYIFPPYYH